ncbi:MAG: hypothetical protein AAF570_14325, partial [Bacteroidota bacterium]
MPQLFKFTANIADQPSTAKSFGVKSADICRATSSFDIASPMKAYAAMSGTLLFQQQQANADKVNIILKPEPFPDLKLPVMYIIYRGLDINDYLDSNNPADPTNKVKTTGLEVLLEMAAIQTARAPGDDIPVEALFGDDLSPAGSKILRDFFFSKVAPKSQLFPIKGGTEIGTFSAGEIGIDIVLENPDFQPDVDMAKESFHKIDLTGETDPAIRKST